MKIGTPFKGFKKALAPYGSISQYFGDGTGYYGTICTLPGFCLKGHNGIDMVAVHGTPILSVLDGRVSEVVDRDTGYGKYVRVMCGDEEWTYGHLTRASCRAGQLVKQGDVVGNMGNTGLSTGTHLHLGVRKIVKGQVEDYMNGYYGSYDFLDRLPDDEEVITFVEQLRRLIGILKNAGVELMRPK